MVSLANFNEIVVHFKMLAISIKEYISGSIQKDSYGHIPLGMEKRKQKKIGKMCLKAYSNLNTI